MLGLVTFLFNTKFVATCGWVRNSVALPLCPSSAELKVFYLNKK